MIIYIVSGTILVVSSAFNFYMTIYKYKDTIKKITKKFEKMGYNVNQDEIKNIFYFDINEITKNKFKDIGIYCLDQKLYETTSIFPIFNLIYNKYNIEYLMGNYNHNKYYETLQNESSTDFMIEQGFIAKHENTSADIDEELMEKLEKLVKSREENNKEEIIENVKVSSDKKTELLKFKESLLEENKTNKNKIMEYKMGK